MPISAVIAGTVEVRLLWAVNGAGAINVLHGIVSGGFTNNQTLANTLGAAIKAQYGSTWAAQCTPQTSLVRVGVRDLRTPNQPEFLDVGAAQPGVSVGEPLPGSIALNTTLRTANSGKSFRGRVYLPGAGENANTAAGVAAPATSTAAVNFVTGISTAMSASGIQLAVASRPAERSITTKTTYHADGSTTVKTLSTVNAKPGGSTAVTIIQARSPDWESQRRRTNGRGPLPTALTAVATRVVGEPAPEASEEADTKSKR